MTRMIDLEFDSTLGRVFIEATIDYSVNWRTREVSDEEIHIDSITLEDGREISMIGMDPADQMKIWAKAYQISDQLDLVGEADDAFADERMEAM